MSKRVKASRPPHKAARPAAQALPDDLLLTKEEQLELTNIHLQRQMVQAQMTQAQSLAAQAEARLRAAQDAWVRALAKRLRMDPEVIGSRYVLDDDGRVRLARAPEEAAAAPRAAGRGA